MPIEELLGPVNLFLLEKLSPCMVIKDCTFITDIRVNLKKHLQYFTAMCL